MTNFCFEATAHPHFFAAHEISPVVSDALDTHLGSISRIASGQRHGDEAQGRAGGGETACAEETRIEKTRAEKARAEETRGEEDGEDDDEDSSRAQGAVA
jgi:hypothetical protein